MTAQEIRAAKRIFHPGTAIEIPANEWLLRESVAQLAELVEAIRALREAPKEKP